MNTEKDKRFMFGFNARDLTTAYNMFLMDLRDRHMGSSLGLVWTILQPLITLIVYTIVFGFIFKAKIPGAETTLAYTVWMISGLGPWLATSEAVMSGANSIWSHETIVKNIPMKTEILPIVSAMTGIVPLIITLLFLFILMFFDGNFPSWHAVLIIPIVLMHFLFLFGIGLVLSPLVLFLRDIAHALPSILMIIMFMTPIFYSVEMMPKPIGLVSEFNPFHIIIDGYRASLIRHEVPSLFSVLYLSIVSTSTFLIGLKIFRRVKLYFDSAL